jgi:PhnB protein
MHIPSNFDTITPYFIVDGAQRFVAFLVNGLGGVELLRHLRPDGHISNSQVRVGTSTVMVSEASAKCPAMPGSYYLYVDNADAALDRALKCGATLEMKVMDMPYQDRQGGVKDAHGNLGWLSQRLVDEPYA